MNCLHDGQALHYYALDQPGNGPGLHDQQRTRSTHGQGRQPLPWAGPGGEGGQPLLMLATLLAQRFARMWNFAQDWQLW